MSSKLFWSFFCLGIGLRLLFALFMNHDYDTFRIIALAKSVADTGSLGFGFFKIGTVQLYGLLFYQVLAAWMVFLNHVHLIDLRYIFDSIGYEVNSLGYLHFFPLLAPELYQMTLIKLFQFVWDIPFLFGILVLAQAVKNNILFHSHLLPVLTRRKIPYYSFFIVDYSFICAVYLGTNV